MTEHAVEIETGDGTCPAALSTPEGEGPWPSVIMFPDAGGMRDTMRAMGNRNLPATAVAGDTVSAKTRRHSVRAGRPTDSPAWTVTNRNVSTVMLGSRNAATSDVTDCGAL